MASTVIVFILAALLHPKIQKTAQEELDAVTMRERLPTFEDRSMLPFVDAICKEVIRWRPITPLGELLQSNSPRLRGIVTTDRCTARKHKR
jgi:cytochrome P450